MQKLPGQTGTVRRYALPGFIALQRLVSPELKVYTISDREALSELVADSASTRRSPSTFGRCWACRRLAMVADKGARWQGTGRGYIVSCALRQLKHALVPVVGAAIRSAFSIFQTTLLMLSTDSRRALT